MNVTDFSQHGLRIKLDILRRELYDADYETKAGYFCHDVSKEIDRLKEANLRQGVKIGDLDRENRTVLSVKSLLTQQLVAANERVVGLSNALSALVDHALECEKQLDEFHGLGADAGSGCSVVICNAQSALAEADKEKS